MKSAAHLFLVAAALATGTLPHHAADSGDLTPQARQDFDWFCTLGFADLKGCPYVRVATGFWWRNQASEVPPQENIFKAFLLSTNTTGFRVLTLDSIEYALTQTNPITKGNTRPDFEILDLTNEVAKLLGAFRNPPAREDEDRLFGNLLRSQREVFILACSCWRNGFNAEAQQLYDQAQRVRARTGALLATADFREVLENDVGRDMYRLALGSFGNTAVARPRLLAQFKAVVTNYPHSQYVERAKQFEVVLKRMVSEDETHARLALANLEELPVEQQVSELIFRLRDQNGYQDSIPGHCNIFNDLLGSTNTPAHQLVRLGHAAVPQLIAALDDPDYSRSVGGGSVPYAVLTVGDCALQILERIAGKTFFVSHSSAYLSRAGEQENALQQRIYALQNMNGASNNPPDNGNILTTRKAAMAWWVEIQQKGEK